MPRPAIPEHSHDLKAHLKDGDDPDSFRLVPVLAWCEEGYPLILSDEGELIQAQEHPHFQRMTWPKADTAQYVPAEKGWRALVTDHGGLTSSRAVVMWRALTSGQVHPIVLEEPERHGSQVGFDPILERGWSVKLQSPKDTKTG